MPGKPIVHLVCNAHIDPVWKWPWEEGAREAISTFHTAADLLEAYPEFIFTHNESVLYEWVELYDPPLFERIRALVRAGRWHISGGWYLQPDVNLPGGETLVRCILEGRRYFDEKFNVRPSVAYNFDSFGHAGSLPQLLAQSGFRLYIHCRPVVRQLALPAPLYRWQGPDGTTVLALRPAGVFYCTPNREYSVERQDAVQQARTGIALARASGQDVLVPWGLGDHGGGPTRDDLDAFRALFEEMAGADVEVRHSTPEAFLERVLVQAETYPLVTGEIQRTAPGCYTSVAPIKRRMRQGEALLASAERWAAIAWWRWGRLSSGRAARSLEATVLQYLSRRSARHADRSGPAGRDGYVRRGSGYGPANYRGQPERFAAQRATATGHDPALRAQPAQHAAAWVRRDELPARLPSRPESGTVRAL